MIWQIVIVLSLAVASYFVPTAQDLKNSWIAAQNFYASSNYVKAIQQYDNIINTQSDFLHEDSVKVELFNGELIVSVVSAAQYQKGNALKNLGNKYAAIENFRIVEKKKNEPELAPLSQFQIYDIYYRDKQYDSAIIEASTLVDKYPYHRKAEYALYDIGWSFRELGNLSASDSAFERLNREYPSTNLLARSIYQLGQNNYDQQNYNEAIRYWFDLNEKFKPAAFKQTDFENVQLKAVKDRQVFEATAGRESEESVLELVAKSQVKIGDAYRQLGDYTNAMINYRKVIANYTLIPTLLEATYIKMAEYTIEVKGLQSGMEVYQKAIDENFANKEMQAKMQYKIAETYQKLKMYKEAAYNYDFYARAYGEVANQINFGVEDAIYTKIICLYNGEDYTQTITEADSFIVAFETSNFNTDIKLLKGLSFNALNKFEEAEAVFLDIIENHQNEIQYNPARVQLGKLYYETKRYNEADSLLNQIVLDNPPKVNLDEVNYYLVLVNYDAKKYDKVLPPFELINPSSNYFIPAFLKTAKSFSLSKKLDEGEKFVSKYFYLADSLKDINYFKPEVHFALSDLFIAKAKLDTASKELAFVIDDPKTNELLKLQAQYIRGTLFVQLNKYADATKDLEICLADPKFNEKLKPLVSNANGRLALAYVKTGKVEKGIGMMENFIANSSEDIEKARYTLALADVYYELKEYKKVITYCDNLFKINFDDEAIYSRGLYFAASSYAFLNDFDKGIIVLTSASDKYPESSQDIFFNFAVSLYDNQFYEKAITAFDKFIAKYPTSPNTKNCTFFKAYAFYKLGKWLESANAFKDFVKQYPNDEFSAEAQFTAGEAHYNASKFLEAIAEYKETYTKYPKSDYAPVAVYNEAWCFYQLKEVDKMIAPLEKLIKEYPNHNLVPEAQFTIGDYYYNTKNYSKALVEYRTFIEKFPNHFKTEEAKSFIKELSQIDAFQEYQKAIVLFDKKDYKNAIAELTKIVEKYPDTEVAMACEANIASAYEQLGDKKKAKELFTQIVEKYKNNPNASGVVFFAQQHLEWFDYSEQIGK